MLLIFTITLAVFSITLFLAILGWANIMRYPSGLSKFLAMGLIFSTIALGIFAAAKFAPTIWDKF